MKAFGTYGRDIERFADLNTEEYAEVIRLHAEGYADGADPADLLDTTAEDVREMIEKVNYTSDLIESMTEQEYSTFCKDIAEQVRETAADEKSKNSICLYDCDIDEDALLGMIEDAEREAYFSRCEEWVTLDRETGKLERTQHWPSDHSTPYRVWKGEVVVLYKAYQYPDGFSPFYDWYAEVLSDDEINEFVKDALGEEVFCKYAEQKELEESEQPVWRMIYSDNRIDLDDAVVKEYIAELMENFTPYDALEDIIREEERSNS